MKSINLFLITLLLVSGNISNAQIQSQLISPPVYNITIEKASTFSIISSRKVDVKAIVSYSGANGKCLEIIVNKLLINQGAQICNFFSIANSINFTNRNFEQYYSSVSEFLPGNYQICLQLYCTTPPDCIGSISSGEERSVFCFDINSISATPLFLSKPFDSEKLHTTLPLFLWIPPMPIAAKTEIKYKMKIVKLNNDQMPEDGIVRNRPIFESNMQTSCNLQYLSVYYPLEKGVNYAWKVEAFIGNTFLTNSEVWQFTIYDKPEQQKSAPEVKYVLTSEFIKTINNYISFSFYEKNQNKTNEIIEYELINSKGDVIANQSTSPLPAKVPGMNFYSIDLCDLWQLSAGKYVIRFKSINAHVAYYQFEYNNNCN